MRKSKQTKKSVQQHTPAERLALRHKKRKEGPSAMRRKERRLPLQSKGFKDIEVDVEMIDEAK